MKLRHPCEHDRYDEHKIQLPCDLDHDGRPHEYHVCALNLIDCPGGDFLPEDALVIEKVEGKWPERALRVAAVYGDTDNGSLDGLFRRKANRALDALAAVQVGEPGT